MEKRCYKVKELQEIFRDQDLYIIFRMSFF